MDGSHFDSLVKGLTAHGSRRRALSGLLAGVVGLLDWPGQDDAEAHDLKTKCKKKSGEAKKKCLKKAKQHNATHTTVGGCTPDCAGKQCGPDGCTGSCGTCSGGATCQGNQCVNGTRAVGATCTQSLPRECASGVCGCTGPTCTCRNATCSSDPPNGCLSTEECCSGFCNAPFCSG